MDQIKKENEVFLWVDLRVSGDSGAPEWTSQRRIDYLLRDDVKRPLSVDTAVWESPLRQGDEMRGPLLWKFQEFDDTFKQCMNNESVWLIYISISTFYFNKHQKSIFNIELIENNPKSNLSDLKFLGYDVADQFLLSGLTNCQYTNDEATAMIRKWKTKINKYHLLDNMEDAMKYLHETERRVPEHAPFFVYGLYLQK